MNLHGRPCDSGCGARLDPGAVVWVDIYGLNLGYFCSDLCRRRHRGTPPAPAMRHGSDPTHDPGVPFTRPAA